MKSVQRISKKFISIILSAAVIITGVPYMSIKTSAQGIVINDITNKSLEINGGNISLKLDYDGKCKISSLKVNNVETLDPEGIISAVQVPRGTGEISTSSLSKSPTVSVSGNSAAISGITYSNSHISIAETWIITANDSNITLDVNKEYHWLDSTYNAVDMKTLGLTFKRDVFDTCFREDGGVNALLSPSDRSKVQDMDDDGTGPEGYNRMAGIGFYGGNVDLLSKPNSFILSIDIKSDRKIASEYRLANSVTHAMRLEHKLNTTDFLHTLHNPDKSLCYHVFNTSAVNENDRHAYDPVRVNDMQKDSCRYTFSASNNLEKYYDMGYFPASSGIDEEKLARFMTELGRTSIVDLKGPAGSWNTLLPEFAGLMESQLAPDSLIAMQYTSGNKVVLEALKALVTAGLSVQEPNGHIRGCAGGQPFEYPDVSESCAGIPLCAAAYINAMNDRAWANSDTVKNGIRKALDYLLSTDSDGNGLVENTYKTNNGIAQQAWLDSLYQGGEDAYINALTYAALVQWADIEANILNDAARAEYYMKKAGKLKEAYNRDLTDGGLWSDSYKSFIGWRNMNGTVKCDTKYLHVDAAAIKYGVANRERMNEILFGAFDNYRDLDDWMIKNGAKAYPLNLYPNDSTEEISQFTDEFPDWENGDVFPHLTGEMMGAYAKAGSTLANKYFKNLIELFFTPGDPLWVKDVFTWSLGTNTHGCNYRMGINMHSAAVFITDVLGIKPRYDCLEVNPAIDSSFYGTEINYYMRGHHFRIKYDSDLVRTLKINDGTEKVRFKWNNMKPGYVYTIKDEDIIDGTSIMATAAADGNGVISYDITDRGEHRVTISDTMNNYMPAGRTGVKVSSENGNNVAANSVDNNQSTYWSSTTKASPDANEWITVDMGQNYKIKKVIVTSRETGIGFPKEFRFKASLNNIDWIDIPGAVFNNYSNPGQTDQTFYFQTPVQARYICMEATRLGTDGTGYSMQISEIKPYYITDADTDIPVESYKATSGFSSTQGKNNWYYEEFLPGDIHSQLVWSNSNGYYVGGAADTIIDSEWMHPGNDRDVSRTWVAPKTGNISISGYVRLKSSGGDGVKVMIKQNNFVYWGWQLIDNTVGIGFKGTMQVNQGDFIQFIVNKDGNNVNDTTLWAPKITYIEEYNASTGFENSQGANNWYYKEMKNGVENPMLWVPESNWWKGSYPYSLIMNGKIHPDTSQSKLVFKAPKSGFVRLFSAGNVRKEASGGDGANVKITKNNMEIWPENGGWQYISGTDTVGYNYSIVVYLNKGDEIGFIVDQCTNNLVDTIMWTPVVRYI